MMALARTSAVVLLIRYCVYITSIHTRDDKRTSKMDGIGIKPNIEYDIVKETPAEGPYEPISTLVRAVP